MMVSKSNKKIITKDEYYQLLSLQKSHKMIMEFLEYIELEALDITEEIDESDIDGRLFLGGYTGDALNSGTKEALDDMLKVLGIEVEKDKFAEKNKKDVGKVNKKKFKSGQWAKNKELDKHKEVIDSPILHDYLNQFEGMKRMLTQEELDEVMSVGRDEEGEERLSDGVVDNKLFVSENWNHEDMDDGVMG